MTCVPTRDADVLKVTDSTSSPALLPQELIDKMIDELRGSRPELKACSMVSHAWRPRAMYHLVSHFMLNLSRHANKSREVVRSSSRFTRFSSPPPSLASLVTVMELRCVRRFCHLQDVMSHLRVYPNLRELLLKDAHFSNFSRSKIRTLSKTLNRFPPPPLCYLRMEDVCFSDCDQFLSFIGMSHFREVSAIDLYNVVYGPTRTRAFDRGDFSRLVIKHCPDPSSNTPSFTMSLEQREGYKSAGYPGMDFKPIKKKRSILFGGRP
ncbi:hypothetical protein K435DRAFT_961982 [Dendrothele bispora CBS 962.96]|uniref:F-box domain-containing protein n=1 Tax=Dendrothele bispora (strain CBS 962.96) TaxID=1314807 RepID=A0A4V4HHW6_DENBC|nr:hypothetical protein K435DRAFT_961982 [Dendrothele bispora CBS 962.96]